MDKAEAVKIAEQVDRVIAYCERRPDGVVITEREYWKPSAVMEALRDIQSRSMVGGETRADGLLLTIIGSMTFPT